MEVNGQQSDPNSETLAQLQSLRSGAPNEEAETPIEVQSETETPVDVQASEESTTPSEPITVDGKQFANESEAYAYVQNKLKEAETEKLLLQARQEGLESALQYQQFQGQNVTPPPTAAPEDDSDQFYADPQGYMKKKESEIEARVLSKFRAEQEDERLWGEFFNAHPDLADSRNICELTLNNNLETIKVLATKDRKKAMDYLATKTREVFQGYNERLKPRTQLPNTKAGPSIGNIGSGVTPTTKNTEDEPVDFISQMRSLRK